MKDIELLIGKSKIKSGDSIVYMYNTHAQLSSVIIYVMYVN